MVDIDQQNSHSSREMLPTWGKAYLEHAGKGFSAQSSPIVCVKQLKSEGDPVLKAVTVQGENGIDQLLI